MKKTELHKFIKSHKDNLPFINQYWEITISPEENGNILKCNSIEYNTKDYQCTGFHKPISTIINLNFFNNEN